MSAMPSDDNHSNNNPVPVPQPPPPPPRRITFWIVIFLLLIAVGLLLLWSMNAYLGQPRQLIQDQMALIRQGRISEAYANMDSQYQQQHSLSDFKKLIEEHPFLSQEGKQAFFEEQQQGNRLKVYGRIDSENWGIWPIDISLSKEDGHWKIAAIEFPSPSLETQTGGKIDKADPSNLVLQQLAALRHKDYAKAYYGVVSKAFQTATSLEEFEQFLRDYPLLTQHSQAIIKSNTQDKGQAVVKVQLNSEGKTADAEYKLALEDQQWRIWSLRLIFSSDEAQNYPVFNAMIQPVKQQLSLLKQGDIGAAYRNYTSLPFRHTTSVEEFTEFVHKFPALQHNSKVELQDRLLQNGMGKLRLALTSTGGITQIEYTLGQEGNEWKVWGLQILSAPKANAPLANILNKEGAASGSAIHNFDSSELLKVVDSQLEALKQHNIAKAYYSFTSTDFQNSTSYKEFENFVRRTPILTDEHTDNFTKLVFNNNIATFSGILTSNSGEQYPTEFDMTNESGQWKVLQILVFPPVNKEQP